MTPTMEVTLTVLPLKDVPAYKIEGLILDALAAGIEGAAYDRGIVLDQGAVVVGIRSKMVER